MVVPRVREVHDELFGLSGELEDLLDAQGLVLRREEVLDRVVLDRLPLHAHDALDPVDVDRLERREVQAAVDGEQATGSR